MTENTGHFERDLPAARNDRSSPGFLILRVLGIVALSVYLGFRTFSVLHAIPSRVPMVFSDMILPALIIILPGIYTFLGYRRVKAEVIAAGASQGILTAIQRYGYVTLAGAYIMAIFLLTIVAETLR
jgi:hypothetical protein